FDDRIFDVPLEDELIPGYVPRARDMTWKELLAEHRKALVEEVKAQKRFDELEPMVASGRASEPEKQEHATMKLALRAIRIQLWNIVTEEQMRPALSLGCFFFVLIGCPVAIWFSKSDYLSAFITCFLPIVVIYYPLVLGGTSMAKEGRISPVVTIWAADA